MNPELLSILADPEMKMPLQIASSEIIASLNKKIQAGLLQNRGGRTLDEELTEGLVTTTESTYLYPIRKGIPVMLIEESIRLN